MTKTGIDSQGRKYVKLALVTGAMIRIDHDQDLWGEGIEGLHITTWEPPGPATARPGISIPFTDLPGVLQALIEIGLK